MPLTRKFRDMVVARAQHDEAFRAALIEEALQAVVDGNMAVARSLLRDSINATIGFAALSAATQTPAKSLMRMVGPNGNPSAEKLGAVLRAIQNGSGLRARVEVGAMEAV